MPTHETRSHSCLLSANAFRRQDLSLYLEEYGFEPLYVPSPRSAVVEMESRAGTEETSIKEVKIWEWRRSALGLRMGTLLDDGRVLTGLSFDMDRPTAEPYWLDLDTRFPGFSYGTPILIGTEVCVILFKLFLGQMATFEALPDGVRLLSKSSVVILPPCPGRHIQLQAFPSIESFTHDEIQVWPGELRQGRRK